MQIKPLLIDLFAAATDAGALRRWPPSWQAALHAAQDLLRLGARAFVAQVFFSAGLTKIRDWDSTLLLFEHEYAVPLLPPALAAWLGTGAELLLPLLLLFGLGGRLAAVGLSVVNAVAVVSLAEIAPAALLQHQLWGALLLLLAFWGPGRLSLDQALFNRSN